MAKSRTAISMFGETFLLLLVGMLLPALTIHAEDITVTTPAQAASVKDDPAEPVDRLEMHAPNDDHAPMPPGLSVAPEAGDASDNLLNAKTVVQTPASGTKSSDVSQIHFYADTDHPKNGTYTIGQQANICVTVQGMSANDTLHTVVKDADGTIIADQYTPVVPSALYWHQCIPVPSIKLGFYRAGIHLMRTNLTLAALRSRPGGYLTYVVLPDPTLRVQYPASQTFFGLQMPNTITYLAPNLGVRWTLASWDYGWRYGEHQYPGQFLNLPRFYRQGHLERWFLAAV